MLKFVVILLCLRHICLGLNDTIYSERGSSIASFVSHWKSRNIMNVKDKINVKDIDWCSVHCKRGKRIVKHIACIRKGQCKPDSPCILHKLDPKPLVEVHNKLRNEFATGKTNQTKGMTVADMNALSWDWNLAFSAACNLKQCKNSMHHDGCRHDPFYSFTGQNLAWSKGVQDPAEEQALNMAGRWYREIRHTNRSQLEKLAGRYHMPPKAGHFSQFVWSRVTHIGCAITTKPLKKRVKICNLVCNYGPGGNLNGGLWFKLGPPASKCRDGKKHPRFSGLCGEEFIPTADPYVYSLVSSIFEKRNNGLIVVLLFVLVF